jgi:pimeloyl-ACP methyl ester carboxylesterase
MSSPWHQGKDETPAMSEHDNAAFVHHFKQLYYQQKEYAQALALLQREPYRFSQQGVMYHWKMCLAALVNDPDQAIQAFREALERGYSYPGPLVREDEDLASLQGMPAYEELVRLSLERFAAAETKARPELLIIPPAEQHADRVPLLLGLHGNPQNARLAANDWQPIAAKGWLVACAQSSQLITSDAYIWNDLARGTTDVQNLYKTLNTRDVIDAERVVLGGISMGGGLAIHMAVTGAIKTRGFFVVGPYLRDLEPLTPYLDTAAASGVRGYIVMGLQEQPEAQEMMRKIDAFLNTHGIPCKIEARPEIAHDFPADFEHSIDKALAFLGA